MPSQLSYPGVYIEELESAVRPIVAVTTSVAAFVGPTLRGPTDTAVTITNYSEFDRKFGGLDAGSMLSYAVRQFYLNGGAQAVIVRVANGEAPSKVELPTANPVLSVSSKDRSKLSEKLRVAIDPGATADTFALRVSLDDGTPLERFKNLSMDPAKPNFVDKKTKPSETIVTKGLDNTLPPLSGTISGALADPLPDVEDADITAVIGANNATFKLYTESAQAPASVEALAILLEQKLRAALPDKPGFARARVNVFGRRLQVLAGIPGGTVTFTGAGANTLTLGTTPAPTEWKLVGGTGGSPPTAADFRGLEADKSGLYALLDVHDVNLLCLPDIAAEGSTIDPTDLLAAAEEVCKRKRMLLIVDSPPTWTTVDQARAGLVDFDSLRSDHAAMFFPQLKITDPISGDLKTIPASGAIAGIMARTDTERGVWKAPAGTAAKLAGVRELTVPMTDEQNGLLNPSALNSIRNFPIIGPVVWGARTLAGADADPSQWKYVPVRRLAFMLEESLYRALKWVVFEPNDENLWAQIRLNVGAFLNTLFRQGAFQGTSAREAYFVKVDKETTTQTDINNGIVNIVVGFAPLRPAEFVVVNIEQMAGQIQV